MKQSQKFENLAGYGIHIDAHGRHALRSCLPLANWTRLQKLFTSAGTKLFFRDPQLKVLAEKDEAVLSGKSASEVERSGITRVDLRDALLSGLEDVVHWGKAFSKYENVDGNKIRAYFADGTSFEGDLLVGADGPNSVVRHQRLPKLERLDLGVSAIAGRYILDDERISKLTPELTNGSLNNIVPAGKGWMFTSAWTARPLDKETEAAVSDAANLRLPEHYVVWAYVLPTKEAPKGPESRNTAVLVEQVSQAVSGWSPELREIIAGSDQAATKCFPLKSMPNLAPWEASNVTLLGDAIHNMTPMAGKGANTALRDAEILTRCILDAAAGRTSIIESVGTYEREMRSYANEALGMSTSNALNACNGSLVSRMFFRGFLYMAETFPAIKRATLGKSVAK